MSYMACGVDLATLTSTHIGLEYTSVDDAKKRHHDNSLNPISRPASSTKITQKSYQR